MDPQRTPDNTKDFSTVREAEEAMENLFLYVQRQTARQRMGKVLFLSREKQQELLQNNRQARAVSDFFADQKEAFLLLQAKDLEGKMESVLMRASPDVRLLEAYFEPDRTFPTVETCHQLLDELLKYYLWKKGESISDEDRRWIGTCANAVFDYIEAQLTESKDVKGIRRMEKIEMLLVSLISSKKGGASRPQSPEEEP